MRTKEQVFDWLTKVSISTRAGETAEDLAERAVDIALRWDHDLLCDLFGDSDQLYDECLAYYQERV